MIEKNTFIKPNEDSVKFLKKDFNLIEHQSSRKTVFNLVDKDKNYQISINIYERTIRVLDKFGKNILKENVLTTNKLKEIISNI